MTAHLLQLRGAHQQRDEGHLGEGLGGGGELGVELAVHVLRIQSTLAVTALLLAHRASLCVWGREGIRREGEGRGEEREKRERIEGGG